MSLEGDIRTALLAMNSVTALVGTGDSARIRPYRLQQSDDSTSEHIIVEVDTRRPQNDLLGKGGLTYADVVISCRAQTRTLANALKEAVKFNGANPGTGLAGYGSSSFHAVLMSEVATRVPYDDGSDNFWHSVELDFTMSYTEQR